MRTLAAFTVLILVAACQTAPPPEPEFTDADRQVIAAEIERLTQEMTQFNEPEEMLGWLAYYSESAESYFTSEPAVVAFGTTIYPTMQAMREFADPSKWNRQSTNFTLQSSRVAVLSPEYAVQVTEMHYTITDMEGVTGPNNLQVETRVWVKENGEWKIIHSHNSWTADPIE